MTKKFTSTVAGASLLITVVGLIGRGLGLVREAIFANFFGLNIQYDLYLVGAVLPITINTVILYLGQNYFIPNYNKIKIESEEKALNFVSATFWLFVLGGVMLLAILFLFSRGIVDLYLQNGPSSSVATAVVVFRIFILTVPLNAAVSVLSAYLQSEYEYKFPAYSQLLLNIAIILLVLFLSAGWGVYTIPAGYVLGSLLQVLYLLAYSKGAVSFNLFKILKDRSVIVFINSSFLLTVLIESISQIYLIADRYLYNEVEKGGIAALNYALNLFVLPITIFSVALSTALFPKLSRSFSENSHQELESRMNNFFSMNLFLFVPISVVFIFYGDLIIKVLFERGAFNISDTRMTFEVLKIYSLSLIFYSSYVVVNKLLYSTDMVKHLLVITVAGCLLKIVLNFILVLPMRQEGLALSSTLSYMFFFIASILLVIRKIKINDKTVFVKELVFCAVNALVSYIITIIIFSPAITGGSSLDRIFQIIIFISIYLLNSYLTGNNSLIQLIVMFKNLKDVGFKNI